MMLITVEEAKAKIEQGKLLFLAGDEALLSQLPKGDWIGGTIPYFMTDQGGITTRDKVFLTELPPWIQEVKINWYDENTLEQIPVHAPENGFSVLIIPATSKSHIAYAQNAPNYQDIFLKPIIGWIAGVHLGDSGDLRPKVFNGKTGEFSNEKAIVMHLRLDPGKIAMIGIVNIFNQGDGDNITFDTEGFQVRDCFINGERRNFADYLLSNQIDIKYPLVADYCGAMVNVSFQQIMEQEKMVHLYAPVFREVEYKIAAPVKNYVAEFCQAVPKNIGKPAFSCNCILNYLYSELEGKKTGEMTGPMTFGEVAYQLLNQTLVYLDIKNVGE